MAFSGLFGNFPDITAGVFKTGRPYSPGAIHRAIQQLHTASRQHFADGIHIIHTDREDKARTGFTVCHFGSEEFLPETPFVLALVEFEGANTLFLTRILGLDPDKASLDWIGMKVRARYLRNSKLKPTDVYFVPAGARED